MAGCVWGGRAPWPGALFPPPKGHTGFSSEGGGGRSIEPPKSGVGVREKGSIDRHHQSVIMNTGAEGAENVFEH